MWTQAVFPPLPLPAFVLLNPVIRREEEMCLSAVGKGRAGVRGREPEWHHLQSCNLKPKSTYKETWKRKPEPSSWPEDSWISSFFLYENKAPEVAKFQKNFQKAFRE